ncbi:hypothetical protein O0L34_g6193 [Tuta absoluta]|nr:hypothetical protein O0L34_g6193 [Tuta absoluta]
MMEPSDSVMTVKADPSSQWGPRENWRIVKNVAVISIAFMVQFTAWHGAANLQSSINVDEGLGTASLAAKYSAVLISSFFMPVVIIKWLGTKWAMMVCFAAYMPYIASQLHPTFYTLIPAAILAGMGAAPLWCAMCTYLAIVSEAHSKISKTSMEVYIARYLGQFFMVFHINQVWGNIISSVVLLSGNNKAAVTSMNASLIPDLCGANFLPSADAGKALLPQPPEKIQMLVGIYLACMAVAMMIIAFGVDSPKRYKTENKDGNESKSSLALLLVTMKVIIEPNQLLLIIISVFVGLQQGFVTADMTVSFVSCAIGPGTVGYVMMTHGVADACGCCITGFLVRVMGRVRLVCCAIVLNTALHIFMLMWRPQPEAVFVPYIIAVIAGLCNSIWLVQVNAYYGIIFPGREEPAFACYRLFEAIGFIITFAISPYLRTSSKIYLLFVMMCVGSAGYFTVEYRQKNRNRTFEVTKDEPVDKNKGCDNKAYLCP